MYFSHPSFQTHDPTQPTKNTNFRPIPDPTQPNPTRGSTQPMDNSALNPRFLRHRLSKQYGMQDNKALVTNFGGKINVRCIY